MKSIIEHAFHVGVDRPVHLYWGVRSERDLYLPGLPAAWMGHRGDFQYTPVLSEPDEGWRGRRGFVHDAVLQDYPDMSPYALYMSGPPVMVYAGKTAFSAAGLSEDHMYSDVFEWAKDSPGKGG